MEIRQARVDEAMEVAPLALMLWPEHSMHAIALEIYEITSANKGAYFLAFDEERAIAFAQVSLRTDYVEGTNSSPIGYLEAIFVLEGYRQQGIGRKLLTACEDWARQQGCEEANRIICFRKALVQ